MEKRQFTMPAGQTMVLSFLADVDRGRLTTGPESAAFNYFMPGQEPANSLPKQMQRVADAADAGTITHFRIQDSPPGLVQMGLQAQ